MTMKIVIVIMITMMSKEKHPSLPLFLVGHSMGGMIALRCVIRSFISPPPLPSLWSKLSLTPSNIIFLRAELRINYFFSNVSNPRNPELFDGFVLNGPLIVPGPQVLTIIMESR